MASAPNEPAKNDLSVSNGLASWMGTRKLSIAFTSYHFGELIIAGVTPAGSVAFSRQRLGRAAGLAVDGESLYLGGLFQLWRLANVAREGATTDPRFDALYIPRASHVTGHIDVHEIGVTGDGKPLLVNTMYNCLCVLDPVHSFRPVWLPPFITDLVGEDRCHLNGLAMDEGRARYVTALSDDDVLEGWRPHPSGGVLIDVERGEVVSEGLSMPHSPRLADGGLLLLESGRGFIVRRDATTGAREDLAFCPGFLRGLSIVDNHAIVTISKPTKADFLPLPIDAELKTRGLAPWCGVLIVNLTSGEIVEWIRVEGATTQLFDVVALPGLACPALIGLQTEEIRTKITFDRTAVPIRPARAAGD